MRLFILGYSIKVITPNSKFGRLLRSQIWVRFLVPQLMIEELINKSLEMCLKCMNYAEEHNLTDT